MKKNFFSLPNFSIPVAAAGKKKRRNRGKKNVVQETVVNEVAITGQTDPPTVAVTKLFPDGNLNL